MANADMDSALHTREDKCREFMRVEGFLVDEAFMLTWNIMELHMEVCQQYPLLQSKRKKHALSHFGCRQVVLFVDLRQIFGRQ